MKGVLFIDGKDAFEEYGVYPAAGTYSDIACLPELKEVPCNDWHERNGVEPDLSNPVLRAKAVALTLHSGKGDTGIGSLVSSLSNGSYHNFEFKEIGRTVTLRMSQCSVSSSVGGLSEFTMSISEDNPLADGYVYEAPSSLIVGKRGDYFLDDVDFAEYGVRVLDGAMQSITEMPAVKENLLTDISVVPGIKYDGKEVRYKSRTAELPCLLRAETAEEFWRNRDALLHDLSKPGARTLSVRSITKDIPCYYKGCSSASMSLLPGVFWFTFTLQLEFYQGLI